MLKRCEDTNLSLNWEKSHFMVKEGIVLGHKISKSGLEVDRAKVEVIAKLPHPTSVRGVRSFLGNAGLYDDSFRTSRNFAVIRTLCFGQEALDILKACHVDLTGGDTMHTFDYMEKLKRCVVISYSANYEEEGVVVFSHLASNGVGFQLEHRSLVVLSYEEARPGTDNQEKDEKQSQNDKTGLGMEKTVKDKAKSKPESQSSQKVNRKVNWSKSKSTQVNPGAKVKEI
ncbi:hypothetical protein Tco_1507784 [Tanacetum coccineum]